MSHTFSGLTFPSAASRRLPRRWRVWFTVSLVLACLRLISTICPAQDPTKSLMAAPTYRTDRILVMPKPGVDHAALASLHSAQGGEVLQTFEGIRHLQIVRVPPGETVPGFLARYQKSGLVEFAEPDYLVQANLTPNDPKYLDGTLWGLN